MDINKDGYISADEFESCYRKICGSAKCAENYQEIMRNIDLDGDGKINYNGSSLYKEEFINASTSRQKLITNQTLNNAFKFFDKDADGKLTVTELRQAFSGKKNLDDFGWRKLLDEIDENKDGTISYSEFKECLEKLIENK